MRKTALPALTLLLLTLAPAASQGPAAAAAADPEREAVRKAVETYLFSEEADEKKGTFLEGARVVFVDHEGKRARVEALAKRVPRGRAGARTASSPQRVLSIDVLHDAASVKVETVFRPDTPDAFKHEQYLWLLKTEAGWRIAGILMPDVVRTPRPGGR
jgi:hypothetical protein